MEEAPAYDYESAKRAEGKRANGDVWAMLMVKKTAQVCRAVTLAIKTSATLKPVIVRFPASSKAKIAQQSRTPGGDAGGLEVEPRIN